MVFRIIGHLGTMLCILSFLEGCTVRDDSGKLKEQRTVQMEFRTLQGGKQTMIENSHVVLGDIPAYSTENSFDFEVSNTGQANLRLASIGKSCSCSSVSGRCLEIAPGDSCSFRLSLVTTHPGPGTSQLRFEFDEPQRFTRDLLVTWNACTFLKLSEDSIVFDNVEMTPVSRDVSLHWGENGNASTTPITTQCDRPEALRAELAEDYKSLKITLISDTSLERRGSITILDESGRQLEHLPVSWNFQSDQHLANESFFMGALSSGSHYDFELECSQQFRDSANETVVEFDGAGTFELKRSEDLGSCVLRYTAPTTDTTLVIRGKLTMKSRLFGTIQKPVVIRVQPVGS